jgi:hypothetical protein
LGSSTHTACESASWRDHCLIRRIPVFLLEEASCVCAFGRKSDSDKVITVLGLAAINMPIHE